METREELALALARISPNINQIAVQEAKLIPQIMLTRHAEHVARNSASTSVYAEALHASNKLTEDLSKGVLGFEGTTTGGVFGVNIQSQSVSYGLSYAYAKSDFTSVGNDIAGQTHMGAAYINVSLAERFALTLMGYGGYSTYEVTGVLDGLTKGGMPSEVNYIASHNMLHYGGGLRGVLNITDWMGIYSQGVYTRYMQEAYTDSLGQQVQAFNGDTLGSEAGIRLSFFNQNGNGVKFKPSATLGVVYDIIPAKMGAEVILPGGTPYKLVGHELPQFGYKVGAGAEVSIGRLSLTAAYAAEMRDTLTSHQITAGMRARL
jgi:hypothetical protein